ncbi:hypothetical protein ACLOJK_023515 [Asimina triloba]
MKASKGRAGGVAAHKNGISNAPEEIDWELRPGGMLVQKRDDGPSPPFGPMIKIKVSHGSYLHEISVPAQATFGDLKRLLAQETGLEPQEQRLLFRGKEKDNEECLHMVDVKDASKVILLEDPASKERKLKEMKRDQGISRACEAVSHVRAEVDKLVEKVQLQPFQSVNQSQELVSALEVTVRGGAKVADKEFVVLTELLMMQLLKLDSIEAEGEAKVQRRIEVQQIDCIGKKFQPIQLQQQQQHSICDNQMGDIRFRGWKPECPTFNAIVYTDDSELGAV